MGKIRGGLIAMLVVLPTSAAEVRPSSLQMNLGTSGGKLSSLAAAAEGSTFKLYSNNSGRVSATFQFASESLTAQSLTLQVRLKEKVRSDVFLFELIDSLGESVRIGTITTKSTFQTKEMTLPSNVRPVSIRITAGPDAGNLILDQMVLVAAGDPVPAPTPEPEPTPAPAPAPTPEPVPSAGINLPPTGKILWDWQIGANSLSNIVPPAGARLIDLDGFNTTSQKVADLKAQGIYTVCYINAGSYEDYRPDSALYPDYLKIHYDRDWDEWFLDVTDVFKPNSALASILRNRIKMCKDKGFDALEPDNLQNDENAGGKITTQQQLDFNSWIADVAHEYGLAVFQKNGPDKILRKDSAGRMMVDKFDAILNEECQQYNECAPLAEYVKRGKLALNVEYKKGMTVNCTQSDNLQINSIKKDLNLVGGGQSSYVWQPCP